MTKTQVTLWSMHNEKMLCGVSCDWLDGSDLITALTYSGISTSGKAQSFISIHWVNATVKVVHAYEKGL